MLVYGIRCSPSDLIDLPTDATADYYLDYSLLVFPYYTKPTSVNSHGYLSSHFWSIAKRIVQHNGRVSEMDFEQPWITDEEQEVVEALQKAYPHLQPNWYHVPKLA
jgi:hypothetical protein